MLILSTSYRFQSHPSGEAIPNSYVRPVLAAHAPTIPCTVCGNRKRPRGAWLDRKGSQIAKCCSKKTIPAWQCWLIE